MNPKTPASCRGRRSAVLPGIAPPQNPTSMWRLPCVASIFASRAAVFTVGGIEFSGMSMIVVTPPAAAARVALANPSQSVRPGSFTCTWVSTRPGSNTSSSPSWITCAPARSFPSGSIATMDPPETATSRGTNPAVVRTREARITRS